jgi:hypothetical protein
MTRIVLAALIAVVAATSALAQTKPPAKQDRARTDPRTGPRVDPFATPKAGADAPRAAAPVSDCSEFGAGFKRAGGTGACVKIGGYVRSQGGSH